jgi:hypothetical protein
VVVVIDVDRLTIALIVLLLVVSASFAQPAPPITPDDSFPRFIVPGHEPAMQSLRNLYWLHYQHNGPQATLWDEWLPPATLWPATGDKLNMRQRWKAALSARHIDGEGYVSTHQHDGLAHADGWPFPLWYQGRGVGWHFASTGVHGYDAPKLVTGDDWTLISAASGPIDKKKGWNLTLSAPGATIQSPPIALDAAQAPFLRLNWRASNLGADAKCYVEWMTKEAPNFDESRRITFAPASGESEVRTMIATYKHPAWRGTITGLRIGFDNGASANVIIKSFHTAYDSRHNINNFNFIRGVASTLNWTGDVEFLRANIDRVRVAMRFAMDEFQTRQRNLVFTPWAGHEGTSGVVLRDGKKTIVAGRGIGSNYWDLLPFGGGDCLATIYYYDTLRDLADLEEAIVRHPEWKASGSQKPFDPADLRTHAADVKRIAGQRFWKEKTGRFVSAIDRDGVAHDYGFTFLNTEAIYHGFATDEQAKSILAWLEGERTVAGDTSSGDDIYHFRFGPRSTTRRNTDYYFWAWSSPESIPWGGQVQDGGAVLGWSYHDLMARLTTRGPDDAWKRLSEILKWFDDTQRAGGYRAYYADGKRGTLQGAGTAGGLGLDAEFVESVLVPQVMLYGFMGFAPTPTGLKLNPRLPEDWPSLQITGIQIHDSILTIAASRDDITVTQTNGSAKPLTIDLPPGFARLSYGEPIKLDQDVPVRSARKE